MNSKEFSFDKDIRICIYNVNNEHLAFHKHTNISDITYCARGELLFELPAIDKSFIIPQGMMFQVPYDTAHRISHNSKQINFSRYVLIQLGKFDIKFVKNEICNGKDKKLLSDQRLNFYIGNNKGPLTKIIKEFKTGCFNNLTEEENNDIIQALTLVSKKAINEIPINEKLLSQLKNL